MPRRDLPSIDELGRDLLEVPVWRRTLCLALPFLLTTAFFVLGARGMYVGALLCVMALSFFTYGSTSHDLVHRTLRLPSWLNEVLLCAIELLTLRSGHAYRIVHLNHHARFPAEDDLEGAAAGMPWWRALLDGVTLQPRLWLFALRNPGRFRAWIVGEAIAVIAMILLAGCAAALKITILPAAYALLVIGGSWIFPFVTSFVPHDPAGTNDLTQTRLFRGRMLSWIALEHLYHLEHHLYPQVPHQNWPKLAHRLDPHFERLGLQPIKLFF